MPMKSKAQWRAMFAKDPAKADQWVHETKSGRKQSYKRLPEHKRKSR